MVWFALPAVPQPGIDATTGVAEPPLVAFLELQAVLLLQLVLVVREALKIYIFIFFCKPTIKSIYSIAVPAILPPKLVFPGPKSNTMFQKKRVHLRISKGMPHLISYTVSRFTCGRLTSGAFEMIFISKKISKKFTFGFADRQLHVTLVSQAFHVHVFHPFLKNS